MLHDDDDPDRAPKHSADEEGSFLELRVKFGKMPQPGEPIELDNLDISVETHFHHITSALAVDSLLMIAKGLIVSDLPPMPTAIPLAVRDQITNMLAEGYLRQRITDGPTHNVSVDAVNVPADARSLMEDGK